MKTLFGIWVLLITSNIAFGQQPRLVLPISQSDGVSSTIFSPNGKFLVTTSSNGTLRIWSMDNGKCLYDFLYEINTIKQIVFSPDSKLILLIFERDDAKIFDILQGDFCSCGNLEEGTESLLNAKFSNDNKSILTISKENILQLWDILPQKSKLKYTVTDDKIVFADFSNENKLILSISKNNQLIIWDAKTGLVLSKVSSKLFEGEDIEKATFIESDHEIHLITYSGKIFIWDVKSQILSKRPSIDFWRAEYSIDKKKIIDIDSNGIATIRDVNTLQKLKQVKYLTKNIKDIQLSNSGNIILCLTWDGIIDIWDLMREKLLFHTKLDEYITPQLSSDGKFIALNEPHIGVGKYAKVISNLGESVYELGGNTNKITSIKMSRDHKKLLVASFDKSSRIWDINTAIPMSKLPKQKSPVLFADFNKDNSIIITGIAGPNNEIKLWNSLNGQIIQDLGKQKGYLVSFDFSPDNEKILIGTVETKRIFDDKYFWNIWNVKTGHLIKDISDEIPFNLIPAFNSKGEIITRYKKDHDNFMDIYNIAKGDLKEYILGSMDVIKWSVISPDKKQVILISRYIKPQIRVYNIDTGMLINKIYIGYNTQFEDVDFINNILFTNRNGLIVVFHLMTGKELFEFIAFDNAEYLSKLPSGYYRCSRDVSKQLHYVDKELKIISFEQLDVKYNRPDKVLQAIGNSDTTLINSYRRAYEKRVEKLKIDTTAFKDNYTVPDADFTNRNPTEVNGKVTLTIKGEDKNTKLDQYNVWVNEVPIYGLRGVNIRKNNSNNLEVTLTIPLSVGVNRIETSVRNINGIESYRKPLEISYTPKVQPKEKVYFVGIGIDKFADASHNLQYSADDIRKIAMEIKKKYGENVTIDTLMNQNVTINNVKAFKKKLLTSNVNDKVIIAYSGHGLLDAKKDYYLSTYSIDFGNPQINGLLYDDLENIIDSIPARKKLLLLDACHSGEVDKDDKTIAMSSDKSDLTTTNNKGIESVQQRPKPGSKVVVVNNLPSTSKKGGKVDENLNKNRIGLNNSFELMQSLFVNVGKNTGATIYAAAGGLQSALESRDLQQSIFTYAFLQALKTYPSMKVSQLKDVVVGIVEEKSNKQQKTTSRSETIAVDWTLW